jgi:6-phosphogluconolactonase (cycloisomerase 2 family)
MLYTVHGDSSEISAFRIEPKDGRLSPVNQTSTNGKNPVHLAVDPTNRFVVIANHVTSGPYVSSLAVAALRPDGALGDLLNHVPLTGKVGPHRVEQSFAKPHQCQFDPAGRFIAVPDKGLDVVFTYRLDNGGKLHHIEAPPSPTREGEGPRHISFHPKLPYAYVINELSSTVMTCRYEVGTGALKPTQVLSCLPDTFIGFSRAAEIEVSSDGRFVYATNRGHDSIAAFAIEPSTGRLTPVGWTQTQGKTPRFFALAPSGESLFVANEESDTVVGFDRDGVSGQLTNAKIVARTGSPTCILFSGSDVP